MRTAFLGARLEELLHEAQLAVAPHEGRLQTGRAPFASAVGHDAERTPEMHGLGLPLEVVLTGILESDRRVSCTPRRVADKHGSGLGSRLDARGGVDEIAGDHALVLRPERDGGLAREHAGAGAERRVRARARL